MYIISLLSFLYLDLPHSPSFWSSFLIYDDDQGLSSLRTQPSLIFSKFYLLSTFFDSSPYLLVLFAPSCCLADNPPPSPITFKSTLPYFEQLISQLSYAHVYILLRLSCYRTRFLFYSCYPTAHV